MKQALNLLGLGTLALATSLRGAESPGTAAPTSSPEAVQRLLNDQKYPEATEQALQYFEAHPEDVRGVFDLAQRLAQSGRHQDAAALLTAIHKAHPGQEVAYFTLATQYVALQRNADAERIFAELENSPNRDLASSAAEALRQLRSQVAEAEAFKARERIYALAAQGNQREVLEAIREQEKRGPLSFPLELQRLYALQSLGEVPAALDLAQPLYRQHPESPELALLRADLLAASGEPDAARDAFAAIPRLYPDSAAAAEVEKRLLASGQPSQAYQAAERIYELARQEQHQAVLDAINQLQKEHPLDLPLEIQRLYAWQSLGQTTTALTRANALLLEYPQSADLAILRARLLDQTGDTAAAVSALEKVRIDYAGTPAANRAQTILDELTRDPARRRAEENIFLLANKQEHQRVIDAVDALEREGSISLVLAMQRLYALQATGQIHLALDLATPLRANDPESADLALLYADLLVRAHRWNEAVVLLKQLDRQYANQPSGEAARVRLGALPAMINPDRWYWGEAYSSGDYLSRYDAIFGNGFIRHGTFIPKARWAQPFQEFRFGVDTRSQGGEQPTILADNFLNFALGMRFQPLPDEYFFLYGQGSLYLDLLDNRNNGEWTGDWQVGAYGYKSWGPGLTLEVPGTDIAVETTARVPAATTTEGQVTALPSRFIKRLDWFADISGNFSYYQRYDNAIYYGDAHQGFRLFQFGAHVGFDAYAVEYLATDIKGNYFDNYVALGPGARILWMPHPGWEVVLRAEWTAGFYFGRDETDTRGGASSTYDNFHVGLSVGARW